MASDTNESIASTRHAQNLTDHTLDLLEIGGRGKEILLQVVKVWRESLNGSPDQKIMVLADSMGKTISATVHSHLLRKFISLREGVFVTLDCYQVVSKPDVRKWSDHPLHLYLDEETRLTVTPQNRITPKLIYDEIPSILDGSVHQKRNIVNVAGRVIKVKRKEIHYVVPKGSFIPEPQKRLEFVIEDWNGYRIHCYALGQMADDFEETWLYHGRDGLITIVLEYWDVKVHQGENSKEFCVSAVDDYSRFEFDPDAKIIRRFHRMARNDGIFSTPLEDAYVNQMIN